MSAITANKSHSEVLKSSDLTTNHFIMSLKQFFKRFAKTYTEARVNQAKHIIEKYHLDEH